jgi:hypothetical protein
MQYSSLQKLFSDKLQFAGHMCVGSGSLLLEAEGSSKPVYAKMPPPESGMANGMGIVVRS